MRINAGGLSEPQGHLAPPLGADEAIERRGFIDGAGLCLAVLDVRLAGRRWAADPGGESSRSHQSLVDSGSLTWEVSAVSSCRQAHQERPRTPRVLTSTSRGLSKFEFGDRYPSVPAEGSPTSPAVPGTQQTEVLSAVSLCGPLPHCFLLCQVGVASSGLSGGAVQSGGAVPEGGKALLFTLSLEGLQVGPRGLQLSRGASRALGRVVGSRRVSLSWESRPLLAPQSFPWGSRAGVAQMAASTFGMGGMARHPWVMAGPLEGWVTGSG